MYDLSVLVLTKNEEDKIARMLRSILSLAKEIIVIDTGSTDRTREIIKEVAPKAKVFYEPFTNFSELLNKGISHCTSKWILALDADETIMLDEYYLFGELLNQDIYDSWKLPRHHWKELTMKNEYKAKHWYPNYSPKLFLNDGKIRYTGYISPGFINNKKLGVVTNGLHIQHFNLVYDNEKKHTEKQTLYDQLIKKQEEDKKHTVFPLDLTTLTLVHDDAAPYIAHMLRSIKGIAKEYVFIDNGEKHLCVPIIKQNISGAKIYSVPFTNFGEMSNLGISHCSSKWILAVDTDEWIDPEEKNLLIPLVEQSAYDLFCIPRKHWRNIERVASTGGWYAKAFPDYQARLFLNNKVIKYVGKVHCGRTGAKKSCNLTNGLHIHHFSFVFRSYKDAIKTDTLYKRLREEGRIEAEERNRNK